MSTPETNSHGAHGGSEAATDVGQPASPKVPRMPGRPIFVLGDSCTGTTSLHNFFRASGIPSLHWFVKEAGLTQPTHLDLEGNERRFASFLATAPYEAFSDYPVRSFFPYLYREYPDASFILTVRSSTQRWLRSMREFLAKFALKIDEAELVRNYERVNAQIRELFSQGDRRFLEVCIDDDDTANAQRLKAFLGLENALSLPKDNATASINIDILSEQHRLYSNQGDQTLDAIEAMSAPSKAMISEYGWAYLINDSNDFLRVQFGMHHWTEEQRVRAASVIRQRVDTLSGRGVAYRKFIRPVAEVGPPRRGIDMKSGDSQITGG